MSPASAQFVPAQAADTGFADEDRVRSFELLLYIDVRQLNPGAGELAKARGERVFCGTIAGRVEAKGDCIRHLKGFFEADTAGGEAMLSTQAYVPEPLGREIIAHLDDSRLKKRQRRPVEFAAAIFAEPDNRSRSRMGFRYTYELHVEGAA